MSLPRWSAYSLDVVVTATTAQISFHNQQFICHACFRVMNAGRVLLFAIQMIVQKSKKPAYNHLFCWL